MVDEPGEVGPRRESEQTVDIEQRIRPFAPIVSVFLGVAASGVISWLGWAAVPSAKRSWKHLGAAIIEMASTAEDSAWTILTIVGSLIAIPFSVIAILGIGAPQPGTARRRSHLMTIANYLLCAAIGLVSWFTSAVVAGASVILNYGNEITKSSDIVPYLIASLAGLLAWVIATFVHKQIGLIELSDEEVGSMRSARVRHYEQRMRIVQSALGIEGDSSDIDPRVMRKSVISDAISVSVLWVFVVMIAFLVLHIRSTDPSRVGLAALSVGFLSSLQLVLAILPLVWQARYIKVEENKWMKWLKIVASILFGTPLLVAVPIMLYFAFFAPGSEGMPAFGMFVSILVLAPTVISIVWPREISWLAVINWNAFCEIEARLLDLKQK